MDTMYRFLMIVSLGMVISSANQVYSDTLYYDHSSWRPYVHYFHMINETNNNGWHDAESIKATNEDTDQNFRVFCVDYFTQTSEDFRDPLIGQEYDAVALDSPSMTLYTQAQKDALNSFFSHVYSTIYDVNGNIIDDANAYFYQLVVWEIVHETSGELNIADGAFGIDNAAKYPDPNNRKDAVYDHDYYNATVGIVNSWLNAITGTITWDSLGFDTITDHNLTIYVAEGGIDVSQTLISVVSPITPEPATMLIFGIGIAALPWLRRRIRKNVIHS
ncbi:MAG: PEP-CTERM sorting domain-containing protein [Planctomycetaceae bacterium]|jgi:hypothetical protein|nr:PEP-CTERM sorting domain-containing protein [Planctomycetaceae bacterium]